MMTAQDKVFFHFYIMILNEPFTSVLDLDTRSLCVLSHGCAPIPFYRARFRAHLWRRRIFFLSESLVRAPCV